MEMTVSQKFIMATIIEDIANVTGSTMDAVSKDFAKFNEAIDTLIKEQGLTEEEAIAQVVENWEYAF